MATNKNKHYISGFTLVEVSIVLVIIGILTTSMLFNSNSTLSTAKLDAVINDVRTIQMAYSQYINITASKPDTKDFFKQLKQYNLIGSENFNKPQIGGQYSVVENDSHQYLHLNNLNEKQINLLQTKLRSDFGDNTDIKLTDDNTGISIQID